MKAVKQIPLLPSPETESKVEESPGAQKKSLEEKYLVLAQREMIAKYVLKEIQKEKKELEEGILVCMRELDMPLLQIMMGEPNDAI